MTGRSRAWVMVVGVLSMTTACLPGSPPDSLLAAEPKVIGMSMEVVEPGPHSTDLLPIPADRSRSEALPGDRVQLTALVANEDGELDLEELEAHWLIFPDGFFGLNRAPPCDPSTPIDPGAQCLAGVGTSAELTIPPLSTEHPLIVQSYRAMIVVGIDVPTSECLERLSDDVQTLGWECVVGSRTINLGPLPRLAALAIESGVPLDAQGTSELPPLPIEVAPDFAPRTPSISLVSTGEVLRAWSGERTTIPAGVSFTIRYPLEPRDQQDFIRLDPQEARISTEVTTLRPYTTEDVLERQRLVVPEGVDAFTMFIVTTDRRGSQTWSTFDFDVEPP